MMTFASFLLGMAGSLAGRVLLSLGFGFVSYQGITAALDSVRGMIEAQFSSAGTVINFLYLGGMGQAVGILLAALSVRGALYSISTLQRVVA